VEVVGCLTSAEVVTGKMEACFCQAI